jgi:hypothetical protein
MCSNPGTRSTAAPTKRGSLQGFCVVEKRDRRNPVSEMKNIDHFYTVLSTMKTPKILSVYFFLVSSPEPPFCIAKCENGGTCIKHNVCQCKPGYKGATCHIGNLNYLHSTSLI